MEEQEKELKHYLAYVKYKDMRIAPMPVAGINEELVIKKVTNFYMDLLNDKNNKIEVILKERNRNE